MSDEEGVDSSLRGRVMVMLMPTLRQLLICFPSALCRLGWDGRDGLARSTELAEGGQARVTSCSDLKP